MARAGQSLGWTTRLLEVVPTTSALLVPPAPPSPDISEVAFQRLVVDLAWHCGWLPWHDNDSLLNYPGLPDLILIRERLIWRELKAQKGRVSPEQAAFGARMAAIGQDWAIWRPGMWDEIVETLR